MACHARPNFANHIRLQWGAYYFFIANFFTTQIIGGA